MIGLEMTFAPSAGAITGGDLDYETAMGSFEARLLRSALIQTGGRKSEAAELLGIPRKRFYLRLRHHDML